MEDVVPPCDTKWSGHQNGVGEGRLTPPTVFIRPGDHPPRAWGGGVPAESHKLAMLGPRSATGIANQQTTSISFPPSNEWGVVKRKKVKIPMVAQIPPRIFGGNGYGMDIHKGWADLKKKRHGVRGSGTGFFCGALCYVCGACP